MYLGLLRKVETQNAENSKGRISQKTESQKAKKWPKGAGRPSLARARFGPSARFGHFVFTGSQTVEEI
jgi:hypothetical protein